MREQNNPASDVRHSVRRELDENDRIRERRERQEARKKARKRQLLIQSILLAGGLLLVLIFVIVLLVFTAKKGQSGNNANSGAAPAAAEEESGKNAEAGQDIESGQDTESTQEAAAASETGSETEKLTEASQGVNATVTLTALGDCTLAKDSNAAYDNSFCAYYDSYGEDYFWQNVIDILSSDDCTLANFEGTLTTSEDRTTNIYAFKSDPSYVGLLSAGSIEAVNIANNHVHDYGESGLEETEEVLTQAGITWSGFDQVAIYETNGVKIGMFGLYLAYSDDDQTQLLKDDIQKLKDMGADIIVFSGHWGSELSYEPDERERTYAKLAIDEGADLVIGTHPHVIQPIEKYNGKYIVYSLGNFCFGGSTSPTDPDCIIFQQTFTLVNGEVQLDDNIQVIPCYVYSSSGYNNYQPMVLTGSDAERALAKAGM